MFNLIKVVKRVRYPQLFELIGMMNKSKHRTECSTDKHGLLSWYKEMSNFKSYRLFIINIIDIYYRHILHMGYI